MRNALSRFSNSALKRASQKQELLGLLWANFQGVAMIVVICLKSNLITLYHKMHVLSL